MNRGYIRVWRKIEDSGIMGNPEVCRLFLHLMLKAAAKPRRQMIGNCPVSLAPGQVIIGRKKLAADLGSTESKVRSGLEALRKMEIISQRATSRFTIVSIVNWGRYQNSPIPAEKSAAGGKPVPRPPLATNKHEEERDTYTTTSGNSPLSPPASPRMAGEAMADGGADDAPVEFLELRARYDARARAEAPGAGIAEYRQARKARSWPGLEVIFDAVDALAARDDQWKRGYAPGLAKFLREKQWLKKPARSPILKGASNRAANSDEAAILDNLNTAARVLAARNRRES